MGDIAKSGNPMEAFQARVLKKLREDIGEMMPDEAIQGLVAKAIEKEFFESKILERDHAGRVSKAEPSWFIQAVAELAEPLLKKAVAEHVEAHRAEIDAAIRNYIEGQNLTLLAISAMQGEVMAQMSQLAVDIANRIRQGY